MTPRFEMALRLARAGIPVFPCAPGEKYPATRRGFFDRTTDTVQINQWWSQADYNVAVVPEDMGCGVIDIDPKDGGYETWAALASAHAGVPATYTVRTPSGGLHLYYKGSLPGKVSVLGKGIDTRGRLSYVLAPSSIVKGVEYLCDGGPMAPLPQWIADACAQVRVEPRKAPEGVELDLPHTIAEARRYLMGKPVVGENEPGDDFLLICRLKDYGLSPAKIAELLIEQGATDCDWLHTIISNTYEYGRNDPGCDRPLTNEEKFDGIELPEHMRPIDNPDELFSNGARLYALDPPPVEELIPGLIEKHCVTYLAGPGGVSKSRIAHHWGSCVHAGLPLYGRETAKPPLRFPTFVYVSYENGEPEDARRHRKVVERLELQPEQLADYVYCGWKGKPPLLMVPESGDLQPTPLWAALEAKLRAIAGHKFIVFDSAYNVFGFQGNAKINETAVQRAINWLDNMMEATDSTGLFIMHPSTAGITRGDNSGWSVAWVNAPRARLAIKPVGGCDDTVELSVAKRNNGPKGSPILLRWNDGLLLPDQSADERDALRAACVEIALGAAEGGNPLLREGGKDDGERKINTRTCEAVKDRCGISLNPKKMRDILANAALFGKLRYCGYGEYKPRAPAGYYPPLPKSEPAEASPF